MASQTYAVPMGSMTFTVTGSFPATYQPLAQGIGPWAPVCTIVSATSSGFTLAFSVPAPAGAFLDVDFSVNAVAYPITAGSMTFSVGGAFPANYILVTRPIGPWSPVITVNSTTSSGWTVSFNVPAPANASLAVLIPSPFCPPHGSATLGDYLNDTRRLLRDEGQSNHLYSDTDLIAFINRAMQQRDLDLGMNRVRMTFTMTTAQFDYPIAEILQEGTVVDGKGESGLSATEAVPAGAMTATVSNTFGCAAYQLVATPRGMWSPVITTVSKDDTSFTVAFSVPAPVGGASFDWFVDGLAGGLISVIDLLSVIVIPLGSAPGGTRYPLARWPYSKMNYLLSTSYPTYPVAYAWYGTQHIMVAPPPANAYPTEFDFSTYSQPLVNLTDPDPLQYPWTDPVAFLAAHFAKVGAQRFDEADAFLKLFEQRMNRVRARGRPFGVANPYFDLPRGAR